MMRASLFLSCFLALIFQDFVWSFHFPSHSSLILTRKASVCSSDRQKSFSFTRLLAKNKVDGIEIQGDLIPVANNILVRVKEVATATKGGLYIPDNAKERPTEGEAVAIGPGRIHPETGVVLDNGVKLGQYVIYGKYDGTELKYNDRPYQLIKDDDVLLVYEGKEPNVANVQPVKDQILVRLPPKEDKSEAGIIITTAEAKDKRPTTGTVVKIGPGRQAGNGKYMEIQVAPGDGVRFREYAGNYVKLDGAEHIVVRAYDILAKWST